MRVVVMLVGVLAVGIGISPPAHAGVNGRTRLHKVAKLQRRLSPQTQAHARAVAELWTPGSAGTASLVHRAADGLSGLVLTNFHVTDKLPTDSAITFGGAKGKVTAFVAGAAHLDYALLHVRFDRKLGDDVKPIQLARRAPRRGERLYTIGFPAIAMLYLDLDGGPASGPFTHFDRTAIDRELDAEPGRVQVITVGHELGGGEVKPAADPDPRPAHREKIARWSFATDLQLLPGASGSPVFSTADPSLLGVAWTGGQSHPQRDVRWHDPAWLWHEGGLVVPAHLIVEDLRRRGANGSLGEHASMVLDLVDP